MMRLHRSIVLVLLLSAACFAEAPVTKLAISADRAQAVYQRGETVKFHVAAPAGTKVQYRLSKDGIGERGSGEIEIGAAIGVIEATLEEPGVIRCDVTAKLPAATQASTAIAGAAIDPLAIKPSLEVPADFWEFWEKQKSKLANEPAKPVLTPVKSPDADIECFDAQINCPGGAPVSGYLAIPKGAKTGSLPALLHPHSAGVRDSDLPYVVRMAKMGLMTLDFNAHGLPNGRGDKYYADQASGPLAGYMGRNANDREKVYFVGMYLRVLRAIDFLASRPQWDGKTLIALGSSQGGGQVLFAAGMDPRITLCLASVPAMCDHTGFVVGRAIGWPRLVPKDSSGRYNERATQAARYVDAMNFATHIKCPTWITVGYIDKTCAATSVYAAYNAIPSFTDKHIVPRPAMGHSFAPDLIKQFDEIIKEAIRAQAR